MLLLKPIPFCFSRKAIIEHHVDFQFELATRKYKTLLAKELERKEVQEGLIKACDVIDLIIEILRGSKSVKDARACLVCRILPGHRGDPCTPTSVQSLN